MPRLMGGVAAFATATEAAAATFLFIDGRPLVAGAFIAGRVLWAATIAARRR